MKKETLEEFLARGGAVKVIEAQVPVEASIPMRVNSSAENHIMSLDEGAHYFAENRKTTKMEKKVSLKDIVDNYNLPKEIADRLRGVNVDK